MHSAKPESVRSIDNIFMKRDLYFILYLLILYSGSSSGQKSYTKSDPYTRGEFLFKNNRFKEADSIYTIAINVSPNADLYFNRAVCKQKLGNLNGFCLDLHAASNLGDKEASDIFWKKCGKRDTNYINIENKYSTNKSEYIFKEIIESSKCINYYKNSRYTKTGDLVIQYSVINMDTVIINGKDFVRAQFPGGDNAFLKYINDSYETPKKVRDLGIIGKIYITFIISKTGQVENINIVKGISACKECDIEAERVLSLMPKWTPGQLRNLPVKSSINLPISIKHVE